MNIAKNTQSLEIFAFYSLRGEIFRFWFLTYILVVEGTFMIYQMCIIYLKIKMKKHHALCLSDAHTKLKTVHSLSISTVLSIWVKRQNRASPMEATREAPRHKPLREAIGAPRTSRRSPRRSKRSRRLLKAVLSVTSYLVCSSL